MHPGRMSKPGHALLVADTVATARIEEGVDPTSYVVMFDPDKLKRVMRAANTSADSYLSMLDACWNEMTSQVTATNISAARIALRLREKIENRPDGHWQMGPDGDLGPAPQ